MTEAKNLEPLVGTHPLELRNVQQTPEYLKMFSERNAQVVQEFKELYAAEEVLRENLGEQDIYLMQKLRERIEGKFARITAPTARDCEKEAEQLIALRRFTELCDLLEDTTPVKHIRQIHLYEWTQHCAIGDADEGYEKWDEEKFSNYFGQTQTVTLNGVAYNLAIVGDVRDPKDANEPTLRIVGFQFYPVNRTRAYTTAGIRFPRETHCLNMDTRVNAEDFLEEKRIIMPEDLTEKLVTPRFEEFIEPAKRFITLVNRQYEEIPNTLRETSRIDPQHLIRPHPKKTNPPREWGNLAERKTE